MLVRRGSEGLGTGHGALRHRLYVPHVLGFAGFRIQLESPGASEVSVAALKIGKSRRPRSYNLLHCL